MSALVTFESLPQTVSSWSEQLKTFPYTLSPQGLQAAPKAPVKSYLLLWAKSLSAQPLPSLAASISGVMQLQACGLVEKNSLLVFSCDLSAEELKSQISQVELSIDAVILAQLPDLSQAGVVLMDMDSTTIQIECIDEIAKLANIGEQVSAVTAAAMRGELDFEQSLRSRVALLSDAPEGILQQVADNMPLMPGLEALIACLHQAGWTVAIASGGFTFFAERLQRDLGFDQVRANVLEIIDGKLTGNVLGGVVDAQVKADVLAELAQQYGAQQTMAIGDGANDLKMLAAADFGVAIHAKPLVQAQAQMAVKYSDLDGVVCILKAAQLMTTSQA